MTSRANYEKELKSVGARLKDIRTKIALNDKRIERGQDYCGFLTTRGLFLGAELARYEKRRRELLYILREKK